MVIQRLKKASKSADGVRLEEVCRRACLMGLKSDGR